MSATTGFSMKRVLTALLLGATALPAPLLAHAGPGTHDGFLAGMLHPVAGLDHVLVMLGVGVLGVAVGGRARWSLPLVFVASMALATLAGISGLAGSQPAEHLIAISVLAIGVPLALATRLSLPAAALLVALCAVVHGHAHGVEAAAGVAVGSYLAGMLIATSLVHASGVLIAAGLRRPILAGVQPIRLLGVAMVVAGMVLTIT